jgi:hypothetical protein
MEDKSLCSVCNKPMYAKGLGNIVEGDNSPETETKVYYMQELTCSDKKCKHKEIVKHPQEIITLEV